MANAPTPKSFNQILGGMIAAFLGRYPVRDLKIGGPILSILEAAAQSDLRNTAETFTLLASSTLDTAEGTALDRIMADENTARIGAGPSTGVVSVTDTTYTKLASVLYQGKPAPLAGSAVLYVTDALDWPTGGTPNAKVYLGRNTNSYEGPLLYDSITPPGVGESFYTINLHTGYRTSKYHNLGETVIVGQGGDRTVAAGSIVQTPQGNTATAVQFSVLYSVILADGETTVDGVQVICTQPGTIGNVVGGSISEFSSPPFTGAICSNLLPFTNGIEIETDTDARARVRNLRQSRTRGTNTAIETYLYGVISPDENKRIASSKVVDRQGYPTTVYIDDGTGYEETSIGVPYEVLTHSAIGGEEYFQLALGRPVTKAFIESVTSEPWNIVPLSALTVSVGGVNYTHTFAASDFRSASNAAAYEVVHSINANPNIAFSARTHQNNTQVILFAKADTNEDIQVLDAVGTTDANLVLQFPLSQAFTAHLYKNDVPLSKDGQAASVTSNVWGSWLPVFNNDYVAMMVDGISVGVFVQDSDFINAGTGYFSVNASNSLASWAAVLNNKMPGITVTVDGDRLRLTSNLGGASRGGVEIVSGPLVTAGMFSASASSARSADYTLNRNTGQLHMTVPLATADKLTAGTQYTQGFLESISIPSTTSVVAQSTSYWLFDGAPTFITLSLTTGLTFTLESEAINATTDYAKIVCSDTAKFNHLLVGDLVWLWDAAFAGRFPVPMRVASAVAGTGILKVVVPIGTAPVDGTPFALTEGGISVARTDAFPYLITIPSGAFYTAESLATLADSSLFASNNGWTSGGHAEVVRNGYARVHTNTHASNGDVALLGTDKTDARAIWAPGVLKTSGTSHVAFVESGEAENDTPIFVPLASAENSTTLNKAYISRFPTYVNDVDGSVILTVLKTLPTPAMGV
jgi:hypothetical protein